jgi:acylglycerol lipase
MASLRVCVFALLLAGCAASGPEYIRFDPKGVDSAGAVHQEFGFAGADGVPLFAQSWAPSDGRERAALIVVHGLKDHSSRYAALADEAVKHGIAVYAFDLRGHGRSAGDRVTIGSFDDYLNDLDAFFAKVRAAEPNKPVFLFGHSMGGCIATLYTLLKHPQLAGLLLSGPAIEPTDDVPGVLIGATHVLGTITPGAKVFDLPNENFSRDPAVVAAMSKDPLVTQGKAPARTAAELLNAMSEIRDHWGELDVPLLAMHGSLDKLTNPNGSRDLVQHAKTTDKTFKLYEGLYHDLLHEPEKAQVTADLIGWLEAHARRP